MPETLAKKEANSDSFVDGRRRRRLKASFYNRA